MPVETARTPGRAPARTRDADDPFSTSGEVCMRAAWADVVIAREGQHEQALDIACKTVSMLVLRGELTLAAALSEAHYGLAAVHAQVELEELRARIVRSVYGLHVAAGRR